MARQREVNQPGFQDIPFTPTTPVHGTVPLDDSSHQITYRQLEPFTQTDLREVPLETPKITPNQLNSSCHWKSVFVLNQW
jgi:hypothetical protein